MNARGVGEENKPLAQLTVMFFAVQYTCTQKLQAFMPCYEVISVSQ